MILLKNILYALGLTQTRCVHCLRPFSPPSADNPAQNHCCPADIRAPLCPECATFFAPYGGPRCPRCGLPNAKADGVCGNCLHHPPPWSGLGYYALYQGAVRDALLRLKFAGEISLAPLLGACLLEAARCLPWPDALIAVPQHPTQLRKRGFNQAHELAKALHKLCDIPLRPELLYRPMPHTPQAGLSAAARRSNVNNIFKAAHTARGLRLWLIDDVMTTGSTLMTAVQALCDTGAHEVYILFMARTPQN